MKKIRAAIVGYGNIGKYTLQALNAAPDFEVAGIVRRSGAENLPAELEGYTVVKDIRELGDVDVAILSTPTRSVEKYAKDILALGINTVDSFDIHSKILDLRRSLNESAEAGNAVSIISAGWDPGSDSVIRTLLEAIAPKGITYTNFGPGMSMGHTVAVKAIEGVKAALSMTIPVGTGIHRRMVYIELEEGYDFAQVAAAIKAIHTSSMTRRMSLSCHRLTTCSIWVMVSTSHARAYRVPHRTSCSSSICESITRHSQLRYLSAVHALQCASAQVATP